MLAVRRLSEDDVMSLRPMPTEQEASFEPKAFLRLPSTMAPRKQFAGKVGLQRSLLVVKGGTEGSIDVSGLRPGWRDNSTR